jgi:hypothetical protein
MDQHGRKMYFCSLGLVSSNIVLQSLTTEPDARNIIRWDDQCAGSGCPGPEKAPDPWLFIWHIYYHCDIFKQKCRDFKIILSIMMIWWVPNRFFKDWAHLRIPICFLVASVLPENVENMVIFIFYVKFLK